MPSWFMGHICQYKLLFWTVYNSFFHKINLNSKNESLLALIGKIKIDFPTFLEFHQKHEVSKLLKQIETEMSDGEANGQANLRLVNHLKEFTIAGISKSYL